ncbi:MAG TPA: LysR family transcriptional regulator [Rhizomicrobium sp.]
MTRLTIRIDFGNGAALGPGKVRLLELIAETGSIRKAAAGMKMSYRQAWLLLRSLAGTFGEPLAQTATGGRSGGGAVLTAAGRRVVASYRALEAAAAEAGAREIRSIARMLGAAPPPAVRRRPVRSKAS